MDESARYGDRVAIPEPYSIEHIPFAERHGHSRQLLWLWLAANLTIADYAIGFLPVRVLGLSLWPSIIALALGNILGGLVLAWSAAMGPAAGYPQMFIGRRAFGRVGGYLPAALNWLSTAGWFTVNTILGSFAIQLALFGIVLAVSFSYIMSWSPYASDYSRYLPEITSRSYIAIYVFIGAALASFLTEVVGMLVAILAPGATTPIAALKVAMGGFGAFAVIAVILGATTANVLNLYSNTMSAKVLDVRLPRWQLAVIGGVLGFILALVGYQNFTQNYQNFLIVLDYWIMPWLAVVLIDYYGFRHRAPMGFSGAPDWNRMVPIAFAIGRLVSLLFIWETFAKGPFAALFGGADFGYFIGFLVAGLVYIVLNRGGARPRKASMEG